jgi:hypothetical protein
VGRLAQHSASAAISAAANAAHVQAMLQNRRGFMARFLAALSSAISR